MDARLQGLNQTWCDVTLSQHWTDILAGGNATNCSLISAASIDSLSSRISNLVASLQEWAQCTPASGSTTNSTRRLLAVRDEDLVRRFLRPGEAYTYCAARLIQPEWVMTAARCVAGESASVVAADRVVFHGGDESACGGGKAAIAEVVVHPGYSALTGANDVALLRLRSPASVPPVALYDGGDLQFSDCKPVVLEAAAYTHAGAVWQAAVWQALPRLLFVAACCRSDIAARASHPILP